MLWISTTATEVNMISGIQTERILTSITTKTSFDTSYIEPDNFDLSINYYQKALKLSSNKEEKARILFQMASAEQGKYYQYEAKSTKRL